MLAIILPFFLAGRVAVDQEASQLSDWQRYGPECTYDVLVNMSLANIVHEKDNFCSMIATELKCRPKGSDTLACRFVNGRIVRPDPEDNRCTNSKNFVPVSDRFVGADPFEVRFNARGIENLVVPRQIPRWRLDMMRAIVGQLNVGFELEKGRQRFVAMENSSIGYCQVEIRMSRTEYVMDDETGNGDLEIDFEPTRPEVVPLDRAGLTIEKVRQPKNCPNRKIYFFGNHEDFSLGNKNTFMDMTTSISHIRISRSEMRSYTETTGIMRTLTKPRTMRLHQKISLSLKSINPARSPLLEIKNPASTSLYAYTGLEGIPEV
ncbi:vitellogenin-like [Hylaeus volcanicus]|uniref:vitellogenin-like n=1 Tax=Hylaeus volcanicus TaxID=313075 RepID=UPI0023B84CB1|nr:vitellogenin-like [Hylaeus volcanicus]